MKKILAILLAALLFCGVLGVGVAAGGAKGLFDYLIEMLFLDGNYEEELQAGLLPGQEMDSDFRDALYLSIQSLGPRYTLANVLTEYFNADLAEQLMAYADAYISLWDTYQLHGSWVVDVYGSWDDYIAIFGTDMRNAGDVLPADLKAEHDALWESIDQRDHGTTLAQGTAAWKEEEVDMKAIIELLEKYYYGIGEPEPTDPIFSLLAGFLPESLASVATFIVKYIFFGWLWGQWL